MKMNILLAISAVAVFEACSVSNQVQKSWTVQEVQQWYNKDSARNNTNSVLYRGSDNQSHHFLSQFFDKWVFLTVKKNELSVPDERPYKTDSVVKLGYYYVDPNNHFAKVREY